ncbi:MAG: hypothetical protein ABIO04_08250 [Ferruginibacter sp.]
MKKFYVFAVIAFLTLLQYCSTSRKTSAKTGGNTSAKTITYVDNLQPTIAANCSPCHFPPKGFKKALDTYEAAKLNIDDIITRISMKPEENGFMPFKHPRLSDSVINVFVKWKTDGLLEK